MNLKELTVPWLIGQSEKLDIKECLCQNKFPSFIDNFHHIENSLSLKDSSHDTILMVFQNTGKDQELTYHL